MSKTIEFKVKIKLTDKEFKNLQKRMTKNKTSITQEIITMTKKELI